jgi:hypothetical protein
MDSVAHLFLGGSRLECNLFPLASISSIATSQSKESWALMREFLDHWDVSREDGDRQRRELGFVFH